MTDKENEMKCYSCRKEVHRDDVRVIANCIEVCPPCYRHLRGLILNGYFDSEGVADEVMVEVEAATHFSAFA